MKIIKTSFGHLVLLMPNEQGIASVTEEIARLKVIGKVAIIVSGTENATEVMGKLLK
jgi:heptaprenylglyceryl phosphate synthase